MKSLPIFFTAFYQPCSQCSENRYMTCSNNTCQCPLHSFWNGSLCENQRYENASCLNDEWCRNDPFGLICSMSNVCISKSWHSWALENLNFNVREQCWKFLKMCSAWITNLYFLGVDKIKKKSQNNRKVRFIRKEF
jgi:hypothetical protein